MFVDESWVADEAPRIGATRRLNCDQNFGVDSRDQ